jgi:hypothetical protein
MANKKPKLSAVLVCKDFSKKSDGAFDITGVFDNIKPAFYPLVLNKFTV